MKLTIIWCLCSILVARSGNAQNDQSTQPTQETSSTDVPIIVSTVPETLSTSSLAPEIPVSVTESTTTPTSTQAITTESVTVTDNSALNNKSNVKFVEKLSDQIRGILKHFQQNEPTGLPGQKVLADPMPAENTTANLALGTASFYNLTIHGLSNFTVEAVNMLLDEMQVYVMIKMKTVTIKGNCEVETFLFTKSKGPFNMTLYNVTAEGTVSLKADSDGKLHANKSSTEMTYEKLDFGSNSTGPVKSMLDGAGMLLLASIKPYILSEIDLRLNDEVNKQLEASPKIPSIVNMSPIDLAILEGRQYVQQFYDPYTVQNVVNHDSQYLIVNVGPVTIYGLSKFARVGNITMQMHSGMIQIAVRMITGHLKGKCKWFYDFGKVGLTRKSESSFYIDYLQFEAKINQSMNLRKTPILDDLQLQMGQVQLKMDGLGDFDYLVEISTRLVPNLLRNLIIDALEESIKQKIQTEILNKINVEKLIEDNISLVENFLVY